MWEAINKESLPHEFATIGMSNFRVLKYGTLIIFAKLAKFKDVLRYYIKE